MTTGCTCPSCGGLTGQRGEPCRGCQIDAMPPGIGKTFSAAVGGDGHPGHWSLHHFAIHDGPGDFTPFTPPDYIEVTYWLLPGWLTGPSGILGPDHAHPGRPAELEAGL